MNRSDSLCNVVSKSLKFFELCKLNEVFLVYGSYNGFYTFFEKVHGIC